MEDDDLEERAKQAAWSFYSKSKSMNALEQSL